MVSETPKPTRGNANSETGKYVIYAVWLQAIERV